MTEFERIRDIARAKFEALVSNIDFEATPVNIEISDGRKTTVTYGCCYQIGPFRLFKYDGELEPTVTLDGVVIFFNSPVARLAWIEIDDRKTKREQERAASIMKIALDTWDAQNP